MITRVQQLTDSNVSALREVGLGSILGRTFVEFPSTPAKALRQLEEQMSGLNARSTVYRSLCAVRRKLRLAAAVAIADKPSEPIEEQVTRYVRVTRTVAGEVGCSYHDETQLCPACTG